MIIDIYVSNEMFTAAEAEILKQNIEFYCRTPKGSLPQMRNFGIDYTMLDTSFQEFRRSATVDIITGLRKFYSVQISEINITSDENGEAKIKIKI